MCVYVLHLSVGYYTFLLLLTLVLTSESPSHLCIRNLLKLFFNGRSLWERSRADLGVGRGGHGHLFFFEIVFYFYRILRELKSISMAGKWASVPATPF